jgi:hypothetical protein
MSDNAVLEKTTGSSPVSDNATPPLRPLGEAAQPVVGTASELPQSEIGEIPHIDDELKEIGAEEVKENPELDEEHKQLGVTPPGEVGPVPVKFQFPEGEIVHKLDRELDPSNSRRWGEELAEKADKWEKHRDK